MKLLDKPLNAIRFDKKYVLYMLLIALIGVITGSLFIVILNSADKILVVEYIEDFINQLKNNTYSSTYILKNTLINNYFFTLLIWSVGFIFIFFPLNIIIIFYKSFLIGFSISSFILTLGFKGIIIAIIYIFPHLIINILLFCLLCAYSLKLSINTIKHIKNKNNVNMSALFKNYMYVLIMIMILIGISSVFESFITPKLLSLVKFIY